MRPGICLIGLALLIIGAYPPFQMFLVIAGLCLTLYGLFSKKEKRR